MKTWFNFHRCVIGMAALINYSKQTVEKFLGSIKPQSMKAYCSSSWLWIILIAKYRKCQCSPHRKLFRGKWRKTEKSSCSIDFKEVWGRLARKCADCVSWRWKVFMTTEGETIDHYNENCNRQDTQETWNLKLEAQIKKLDFTIWWKFGQTFMWPSHGNSTLWRNHRNFQQRKESWNEEPKVHGMS